MSFISLSISICCCIVLNTLLSKNLEIQVQNQRGVALSLWVKMKHPFFFLTLNDPEVYPVLSIREL